MIEPALYCWHCVQVSITSESSHRSTLGMTADNYVFDIKAVNCEFDSCFLTTSRSPIGGNYIADVANNKYLPRFGLSEAFVTMNRKIRFPIAIVILLLLAV